MVCLCQNSHKLTTGNYIVSPLFKVVQLVLSLIIRCVLQRWLHFSHKPNKKLVTTSLWLKSS